MKGDSEIIAALNEVLTGELTAINQYFLHARMCDSWGYKKLAKAFYDESIEEMKHAQDLIDRVLFLEGLPNLQKLDALNIGETIPEQLAADLETEKIAIPRVKKAIKLCIDKGDHGTRELLEHILVDEEKHLDWLESQLLLLEQIGKENFLSNQV